jgi:hypothetical protein
MYCLKNCPKEDLNKKDFIDKLVNLPEDDPFVIKW